MNTLILILLSLMFSKEDVKSPGNLCEDEESISISNKTRFQLAVSIKYRDSESDWVIRHLIINSGDSRTCCSTDNSIVYYYAVDTHGYGWQISGSDTYEMNYYNSYVGFRKKSFGSSGSFRISLIE